MKPPALSDYLHLHFIVLIWGFTAILGKFLEPLSSPAVVLFRTGLAAGGLALVLYVRKQPVAISPADRWRLLATGGLIALHWILFFAAARLANVSVCLAGMATSSLWASLLEPLILKRRIQVIDVLLGAVVMAGLYLIFRFEFDKIAGLLTAILSAMLSSLFTIINSRFSQRHDALVISFYEMVGAFVGCVAFVGLYIATNPTLLSTDLVPQTGVQWLCLSLLAFVCTVYAHTAAVGLLRKFSPYLAILTVNLEPVYGIILAVLIFGNAERMTAGFYIGTLVILAAVISYPFLSRQRPATTTPTGGDLEIDLTK